MASRATVRQRTWGLVEATNPADPVTRWFSRCIVSLILLNVGAVVIGSVASVDRAYHDALGWFELISVGIFSVEYLARMWSCVEDARFCRPIVGRLKQAVQPLTVVDLAAVLPFFLPLLGVDLRFMRAARFFRIFRIAKIGRYSSAMSMIRRVIVSRHEELLVTTLLAGVMIVMASCLVFQFEHEVQPVAFADIPSTLWWAVVTLTTIGYGDVVPVTFAGKTVTALMALVGIGVFALPAGILCSGFIEQFQEAKAPRKCPHCGQNLRD